MAGKLSMKERMFKTMTGKDVALRIFVQENNLSKVKTLACLSLQCPHLIENP